MCSQQCVTGEKTKMAEQRHTQEDENQLSLINKEEDTVQGPTNHDDEIGLQKAWTMGMPMIDGDMSTIDSEELE